MRCLLFAPLLYEEPVDTGLMATWNMKASCVSLSLLNRNRSDFLFYFFQSNQFYRLERSMSGEYTGIHLWLPLWRKNSLKCRRKHHISAISKSLRASCNEIVRNKDVVILFKAAMGILAFMIIKAWWYCEQTNHRTDACCMKYMMQRLFPDHMKSMEGKNLGPAKP